MKRYNLSFITTFLVIIPLGIISMFGQAFENYFRNQQVAPGMLFSPTAITADPYRQVYDIIKKFPGFAGKVITKGYMRFCTALTASQPITFNVFQDAGTVIAGENRLKTSDAFFSIAHQFLIGKIASGGNILTMKPQPWANPQVFTGATEILGLQQLYWAGLLNITINNRVYYDSFNIGEFQESKNKEEGLLMATGGEAFGRDNWKGDETCVRPLVPTVFYNGSANITCQITVPLNGSAFTSWAGESSSTNYAIYTNYGFYIKGGAQNDDGKSFGQFISDKA